MSKVGLFKTTRERRTRSLLFWRSDSLEHGLNISETPRSCALQRVPVRWTLTLETNHLWSLGPCQCRNTTEQRLQRRAFPVTSRSRGLPEGARTDHVTPKQRTELTRENEAKASSLLQQQTASITNKAFFILTKLVKFDLNAVTEQRHLSWSFPVESSVKIAKRANFNSYEFTYQNPLCMCMFVYYQLIHLC